MLFNNIVNVKLTKFIYYYVSKNKTTSSKHKNSLCVAQDNIQKYLQ